MLKRKLMKQNSKKVYIYILVFAILLFALRYVPMYESRNALIDETYSLQDGANLCDSALNNPILNLVPQCSWVEPLNVIVWILIALTLIVGIVGLLGKYFAIKRK
jgi:uncharacterized protein involved in cysteine biosynthesis